LVVGEIEHMANNACTHLTCALRISARRDFPTSKHGG